MLRATAFDSTGETGVFDEGVTRPHTSEDAPIRSGAARGGQRRGPKVGMLMLERLGLHVDVVADGESAVQSATATAYVAILMDCRASGPRRARRHSPHPALAGTVKSRSHRRCDGVCERVGTGSVPRAGMDDVITSRSA